MEQILNVFTEGLMQFTTGTGIWTLIIFAAMLLILWKYAWGPIINGLDKRAAKIEGDLKSAENEKQEAQKLKQEAQKNLDEANEKAYKIITQGKQEANDVRNDIINKAKDEANRIKSQAENDIKNARKKAVEEMRQEMVLMSIALASKIVKKNLTKETHNDLINGFLEDYEKKNN